MNERIDLGQTSYGRADGSENILSIYYDYDSDSVVIRGIDSESIMIESEEQWKNIRDTVDKHYQRGK